MIQISWLQSGVNLGLGPNHLKLLWPNPSLCDSRPWPSKAKAWKDLPRPSKLFGVAIASPHIYRSLAVFLFPRPLLICYVLNPIWGHGQINSLVAESTAEGHGLMPGPAMCGCAPSMCHVWPTGWVSGVGGTLLSPHVPLCGSAARLAPPPAIGKSSLHEKQDDSLNCMETGIAGQFVI